MSDTNKITDRNWWVKCFCPKCGSDIAGTDGIFDVSEKEDNSLIRLKCAYCGWYSRAVKVNSPSEEPNRAWRESQEVSNED